MLQNKPKHNLKLLVTLYFGMKFQMSDYSVTHLRTLLLLAQKKRKTAEQFGAPASSLPQGWACCVVRVALHSRIVLITYCCIRLGHLFTSISLFWWRSSSVWCPSKVSGAERLLREPAGQPRTFKTEERGFAIGGFITTGRQKLVLSSWCSPISCSL